STFLRCGGTEPNYYSSFCTQVANERLTASRPAPGTWTAVITTLASARETVRGVVSIAYPDGVVVMPQKPSSVTVETTAALGPAGRVIEVTATVRDANGDPVPNAMVSWSSTGVGRFVGRESVTGADGKAKASVVSDAPGTQTLVAEAGEAHGELTLTWLGAPGVALPSTIGVASGGGWIRNPGKQTFSFYGRFENAATAAAGHLSFNDHAGMKVASDAVEQLTVVGSTASLTGPARVNGVSGYRFLLEVKDGGSPGKGLDSFRLVVRSLTGVVYQTSGLLGGGELEVRQE
ncbi:MAG: post-COAP-1 domain-containing protein, partial [Myxococcales bacterium]